MQLVMKGQKSVQMITSESKIIEEPVIQSEREINSLGSKVAAERRSSEVPEEKEDKLNSSEEIFKNRIIKPVRMAKLKTVEPKDATQAPVKKPISMLAHAPIKTNSEILKFTIFDSQ